MGIRRDAREWALQFLFQSEFNSAATLDEGFRLFWEEQDRARAEEDAKAARLGRPAASPKSSSAASSNTGRTSTPTSPASAKTGTWSAWASSTATSCASPCSR